MMSERMKNLLEKSYVKCILSCAAATVAYMVYLFFRKSISEEMIKAAMAVLIVFAAAYAAVLGVKKQLDTKTALRAVIFVGFVMRISYMLYTPCDVRSHDLWGISADSRGHAGYILWIIKNGTLPQSNEVQFYQQPFFYIVGSAVSRLVNVAASVSYDFYYVDAAKIVSCAASCMILIIANEVCEQFRLSDSEKLAAMLIAAFHPEFFLGIRLTPDMLSTFFMTLALLFTFKWRERSSWKNTLILAVVYGLGVMTKISVAVPALFTAVVFAVKLVRTAKEKKVLPLLAKLAVFGAISLPLGLWYSVRNYIKFGQKLGYVMKIDNASGLYVGDHSVFQRFVIPDFKSMLSSPYGNVYEDYNLFVYSVKSSLFGEFSFDVPTIVPMMLYISALVLAVMSVIELFFAVKRFREDKDTAALAAVCILFLASVIAFNIGYPHGCSMDFRYNSFLIIPFAVFSAKHFIRSERKVSKVLFVFSAAVFSLSSCVMYILA